MSSLSPKKTKPPIKIYRKAAETRTKELEIAKQASNIEKQGKKAAEMTYDEAVERIVKDYTEALKKADDKRNKNINDIDSAEKATEAIKDKLK